MIRSIFMKVAEEAALGLAALATPAIINGVKKHGPTVLKAAKEKAPETYEAVKDKTADAAATAKAVGSIGINAVKRKFGK